MLKKVLLFIVLIIFFLYGLAVGHYHIFPFEQAKAAKNLISNSDHSTSFVKTPYYLHKTTFFELNHRDNYDVVFVGDSITDYSDWYDIFTGISIANRGIAGDTTTGILNRMNTITNTGAKQAFIMIGTNDISANENIDIVFNNYVEILHQLDANNIRPIVQSTLLTYDKPKTQNDTINQLNDRLKDYCSKVGITYIDLNKYLASNGKLESKYSYDGLHLNGQGYAVWSEVISKYISN